MRRLTPALLALLLALLAAAAPAAAATGKQQRSTRADARQGERVKVAIAPRRAVAASPARSTRAAAAAPATSAPPIAAPAPAPAAAPAPAPSPRQSLSFHAARIDDFWLAQSAPGAITEAPDPAGSGRTVIKMTVADGDVYPVTPTENPRAELISPEAIEAGDELWWSASFYLPADFPSFVPGWLNLLQGPFGRPYQGSPPWHVEVNGDHIQWARNRTYGYDVPWRMPLVKERWVTVTVHERFANDGFVEMWVDGRQVTFFDGSTYNPNRVAPTTRLAMATMDSSNHEAANTLFLQSYRKRGMFPTVTTYYGGLTIGETREAVGG